MRKNFTLCTTFLLLALSTGGGITARAADGDRLTTVAAAAGKSFTIKTERGYWYANGTGNNVSASKGDFESLPYDVDFNSVTTMSRFTIVKNTNFNRYYLYSIDCSKWVSMNGNNLSLVDSPVFGDSIGFTTTTGTRATTYPTCIYFGGNTDNMYGISPKNRTPDVFKYKDTSDQGNNSAIIESGTITTDNYNNLVSVVDGLFGAEKVVSASPIADPSDFNGQADKAYLIHNVSSSRNGYLHVDASGNITWKATLPNKADADFNNFVFTTVLDGGNIYLKANNGEYIPIRTKSSENFTTTADKISGAGVATVVAKSGYKASTLNFKIDGHYMNVNNNGVVTTWDYENDANGVWEFTPVDTDNSFITTTIVRHITSVNGNTFEDGTVQYSSDQSTTKKYRSGQHIYIPTAIDFFSGGIGVVGTSTQISVDERLPFEVSSDNNWHWYHLSLRSNKWMSANSSNKQVTLSTTFTDNDYSLWAFKGSYNKGIQLYNKGLGTTNTLKDNPTPSFTEASGNNNFIIALNNDGFTLRTGRSGKNCFNDVGNNNSFGYWNNASALTDDGSTFRVFLPKGFYTLKNYVNVAQGDSSYGYLGLSGNASTNKNIMGNNATASLNEVVYIAPTSAPSSTAVSPSYVTMQLQGKGIQGVSPSTQVTVGDNNVSFKVAHPNIGYFAFGSAVSNATPDNQSYLHTANSLDYKVVGWSTDASATSWQVSPASAITMPANAVDGTYYATFYAPFAVKLTGAKAYTLTLSSDKSSATLNEVTLTDGNVLPANSPVLIISNADTYTVEPVISEAKAVESILTGVSLAESWSSHTDDLVLGQKNGEVGFYKWNTNNPLKNNRCYLPATKLTSTATAKGVTISSGSTPTGINAANLQPAKNDGKIYNLQGQEVGQSYKGIVIKDGHKVIQ